MAVFKNTIVTDAGRRVLSDALANSKKIIFTKISTSNKEYQDTVDIAKIITLENVKQTTTLSNIRQEGTQITINAVFTNSSVETAYLINTIELYAKVEDGVEILFSITRASTADTMPANNGINLSTVEIDLVTEINNTDGATIEFNPSTLVTFSTLATTESAGITKYGIAEGTALEGKRLGEILGAEFDGIIQDTGKKEQGKIYYDTATKYYYECLVNNDLTYNESTKFRAISNKPISNRLENLFSLLNFKELGAFGENEFSFQIGDILVQGGSISSRTKEYILTYPRAYKHKPKIIVSNWLISGTVGHSGRSQTQCSFFTTGDVIALDWITIGIV